MLQFFDERNIVPRKICFTLFFNFAHKKDFLLKEAFDGAYIATKSENAKNMLE